MRIALLSTHERTRTDFQDKYPEIEQFTQVNDKLLDAQVILLQSVYEIEKKYRKTDYYQIFRLWKEYAMVHKRDLSLVLIGRSSFESTNYLSVLELPEQLETWAKKTLPIKKTTALSQFV